MEDEQDHIVLPSKDDCMVMPMTERRDFAQRLFEKQGATCISKWGKRALGFTDGDRNFVVVVEQRSCQIQGDDLALAADYTRDAGYEGAPIVFSFGETSTQMEGKARLLGVKLYTRASIFLAVQKSQGIDGQKRTIEQLHPQVLQQFMGLLSKFEKKHRENKLRNAYWKPFVYKRNSKGRIIPPDVNNIGPYKWQCDIHNAGLRHTRRALIAANRVGKSEAGAGETSMHALGEYPDWWRGKRFKHAPTIVVGSDTNENSVMITQAKLLGEDNRSGYIPPDKILDISHRQAGISGVVHEVKVRHKSGGVATIIFKSYEQGRKKWQGTAWDFVWLDEEPPMEIYTEAITRLMTTNGCMLLTFTPLNGVSDVVKKFVDDAEAEGTEGKKGGRYKPFVLNVTWDDAPHLTDEIIETMLEAYPAHERDCRSKGVPLAGAGMIFPFDQDQLEMDINTKIMPYWPRVCGIDFGMDHPFAAAWLAYDTASDTVYVYDGYKKSNEAAPYHVDQINSRGEWIPTAWPHDGDHREASGETLADYYRGKGLRNMLPVSARHNDEKGGPQPLETIITMMKNRMRAGKLKVHPNLSDWFREQRMYHKKATPDGGLKIVKKDDDLLSATMQGLMMLRYAVALDEVDDSAMMSGASARTGDYDPYEW